MSAEARTHVLVVDDSAVVRQTITALLHYQPDITTSIAADPLIAIEKMKKQRPDVILLDLEMPRMDGLTFLKKVMAEDPTPVIVCSELVGDGSEQAMLALENGAVDLIAKPQLGVQAFLHEAAVTIVDSIRAAAALPAPQESPAGAPARAGRGNRSPPPAAEAERDRHRLIYRRSGDAARDPPRAHAGNARHRHRAAHAGVLHGLLRPSSRPALRHRSAARPHPGTRSSPDGR